MGNSGNIRAGGVPPPGGPETMAPLASLGGVRIERIASPPAAAPGEWYDQDHDEWVMVVEGDAEVRLAGPEEAHRLRDGDWLFLPARRRHRVERVEKPTVWLALHGAAR